MILAKASYSCWFDLYFLASISSALQKIRAWKRWVNSRGFFDHLWRLGHFDFHILLVVQIFLPLTFIRLCYHGQLFHLEFWFNQSSANIWVCHLTSSGLDNWPDIPLGRAFAKSSVQLPDQVPHCCTTKPNSQFLSFPWEFLLFKKVDGRKWSLKHGAQKSVYERDGTYPKKRF